MPRLPRKAPGGVVYHVLNRGVARLTLFHKPEDYHAFERVIGEAMEAVPTRLLAYCLMPNHWHFILWPREDGELTRFVRKMSLTHSQRYHAHYHSAGTGHIYQGRFKSFPIQEDDHLLTAIRYVERNPLRANLAERAEDWPWSSLHRREHGGDADGLLCDWPVPRPADWVERVNRPQSQTELAALRTSSRRGTPFGDETWTAATAVKLGLDSTLRPRGRPKKPVGAGAGGTVNAK